MSHRVVAASALPLRSRFHEVGARRRRFAKQSSDEEPRRGLDASSRGPQRTWRPRVVAESSRCGVVCRLLATERHGPMSAKHQLDLLGDADQQLVDAMSQCRRHLGVLATAQLTRVGRLCVSHQQHVIVSFELSFRPVYISLPSIKHQCIYPWQKP